MTLAVIFDSIGFGEWFVLLAVVLVVVGPKRLPEVARTLGRWYSRICRATNTFKRQLMEMESELNDAADSAVRNIEGAFTVEEPVSREPQVVSDQPS